MLESIISKNNSTIKEIKKLKDKKYRTKTGKFIVEGFRFVEEAVLSEFEVEIIIISENSIDKLEGYSIKDNIDNNTKVFTVDEAIFKSISCTDTPQGIIAVIRNRIIERVSKNGFYILADKVQDPGNMGTIIRTAHASGANGVIITKGTVDVYNEKTLRSTMGSIFKIPVILDGDLTIISSLKENGYKVISSSLEAENNFYDVDLVQNIIITVGNEGNGISDEIYKLSDIKVKIPMPGDAESLNAGVAASIMMYESVRQRLSANK